MYIFTKLALIAKSGLKETAPCSSSEIAEQSVVYQLLPHLTIWEYFTWLSSGSEPVSMWERHPYKVHSLCHHNNIQSHYINWFDYSYSNVYMRPEVNSNRFEISNRFEMFWLHGNLLGDFNFPNNSKTLLHMCKWYLLINAKLNYIMQNRRCTIGCFLNNSEQAHAH